MVDRIQADLKEAQLVHDGIKVSTLRLLLSEIHNAEIAKGVIEDADVIAVLRREAKKRKEAAVGFRSGNREESALKEEAELKIIQGYLPAEMDLGELTKVIESTITEVGAASIADMGKVMGVVMGKVNGRADGSTISGLVKERLSK